MEEDSGIGGVAGLDEYEPRRNRGGFWWCLTGLIVGLALGTPLGWFGPKILKRMERMAEKKPDAAPTPVVVRNTARLELLRIEAQPAQRGLQLSSPAILQLLKPSESKRTQRRGQEIFSGFRDWTGTARYLANGQGQLVIKTPDDKELETNWQNRDYRTFLSGGMLQVEVPVGKPYTLYFQRKGQRGIDLGTFRINVPAPKPAKAAKPAALGKAQPKSASLARSGNGKSR
jgi:hypothetical protein